MKSPGYWADYILGD